MVFPRGGGGAGPGRGTCMKVRLQDRHHRPGSGDHRTTQKSDGPRSIAPRPVRRAAAAPVLRLLASHYCPAEPLKVLGNVALAAVSAAPPVRPRSIHSCKLTPLPRPTVEDHVHSLLLECVLQVRILSLVRVRDDEEHAVKQRHSVPHRSVPTIGPLRESGEYRKMGERKLRPGRRRAVGRERMSAGLMMAPPPRPLRGPAAACEVRRDHLLPLLPLSVRFGPRGRPRRVQECHFPTEGKLLVGAALTSGNRRGGPSAPVVLRTHWRLARAG